jgi:hypothetical protein
MQAIALFLAVVVVLSAYSFLGVFKKTTEAPKIEEIIEESTTTQDAVTITTTTEATTTITAGQTVPQTVIKTPATFVTPPATPVIPPAAEVKKVTVSPYLGKVKISSVSHSQIILRTQFKGDEIIDITNWKIKGRMGEIIIPQGIELFIPENILPARDILLKTNESIYLLSARDPFNLHKGFRPNKCFGYLKSSYKTSIPYSYSKICPKIDRNEICYFSQACQSAVLGLQSCNRIDYSKNMSVSFDSACQAYIDNYTARYLNYGGCIETYSKDTNFFPAYWHFYAGYDIVCKCTDTIYLYDQSGLVVDKYENKVY